MMFPLNRTATQTNTSHLPQVQYVGNDTGVWHPHGFGRACSSRCVQHIRQLSVSSTALRQRCSTARFLMAVLLCSRFRLGKRQLPNLDQGELKLWQRLADLKGQVSAESSLEPLERKADQRGTFTEKHKKTTTFGLKMYSFSKMLSRYTLETLSSEG